MSQVITHIFMFMVAFTAATILPGSSEVALAASIAANPGYTITLFLSALTGNVLGSVLNWALGRWAARLVGRRGFPVTAQQLARASTLFNRYGNWLLLFSWAPFVGDPLTVVSGSLRVNFWLFLILVTFGKAVRYLVVVGGVEILRGLV